MALRIALARSCFGACVVFSLNGSFAADLAAPVEYEGRPIASVRYEPESQPVARADLARLVPFEPGTPLRLAEVRAAIKRLYGTGRYSDIEVDTEAAGNGVTLVIRTTEQWFIGPVEVRGKVHYPPNEGQLANAARLELGSPFDDTADLDNAVKGIGDLLRRNGLYLAKVDPKVERDLEHQQLSFTFQVDSGKRARLTDPAISGNTGLPAEKLEKGAKYHALLPWPHWKQATQENTQSGLQNIRKRFNKDGRLAASVSFDHMDYLRDENRVRPNIKADGGPKIKIEASGAKVSKGKLQTYVPVYDEETVNTDLLVTGVRNLRDYFQNQGYFEVTVDFRTDTSKPDLQTITYLINPGERHKLVKLDIQGNHYFTTTDLRERMYLQPAGFLILRHGRYSEGFVKRDQEAIQALYRSNGFRDAKVTMATTDDYREKKGDVAVTVTVDEGPQYRVSKIAVTGVTRPDKDAIVKEFASSPGQPYSEANVGLDREHIMQIYQSAGYPDVSFDWKITPGPGPTEMSLEYVVTEGEPRYVRDVLITGLRTTRHRLVDPNIMLKAGDPLSWTNMGIMQRRLYNLGVFDKVDMAIQNPQGDTQHKYVLYHLTEGHRYYVAAGVGAEIARIGGSQSSVSNAGGTTGFAPRADFEVSRLNLWGLGHSLNFKSRYSTLDRRVSLNYLAPRYRNVDGRNISVTALYDNTRDVLTFTARRLEGSAQISQKLSKPTTILWRYTWRDVRVDPNSLKINQLLVPLASQPARIAMIATSIIQDRRDDPVDAHRGIYNTLDAGIAEHAFGGNKNFLRILARNSYYKRVKGDWVLASNTEFGWIRPFRITPGVDSFNYIPIPEHFFGGGSTSLRAFPDNQAGPRDLETGFPLGGNALLFHATELRFPFLSQNIGGVLFHDMGNVYSDLSALSFRFHQRDIKDFDYMAHAAGFGIRYRTPVGPVRVDLAYSFNPPTFFGLEGTYQQFVNGTAIAKVQSVSHFQFFFSIGQAF